MERSIASLLLLALMMCISLGASTPARAALATVSENLSGLVSSDTTPMKKKIVMKETKKFALKVDDKDVELTITDGKIDQMKVNGAVVPEADYGKYAEITDPLLKTEVGTGGNEVREIREMTVTVDDRSEPRRSGSESQNRTIIINDDGSLPRHSSRGEGSNRMIIINNDSDETINVSEQEIIGADGIKRIERTETRSGGRNSNDDRRTFSYSGPEGSRTIQIQVDDNGMAVIRRNGVICDSLMSGAEERIFDIHISEDQLQEIRLEAKELAREMEGQVRELHIIREDSAEDSIDDRLDEQEELLREQRIMLREQERRLREQERELKRIKKDRKKG